MSKTSFIIGIAGPSGSGKSTLCAELENEFENLIHLKMDDFFKDIKYFPMVGAWRNWEVPENIKFDELIVVLEKLRRGESAQVPVYSRREGKQIGERTVGPAEIIVVEGFLLFLNKEISKLLDYKIYLDLPLDKQLERRLKRQPDLDMEYFTQIIVPGFRKYEAEIKSSADQILDATQNIDELKREIKEIIKNYK